MSKFFADVGEVVSLPAKTVYNFVTGNPKGNSIGDIWNNTVGPGNPVEQLISDAPGQGLLRKAGISDISKLFTLPNWDTMGRPGEAFAEFVDTRNAALPKVVQPYAQPVETAILSAFNPYAGAAFNTAYQGGKQQQQNKGYDWGELGKQAALNFGTAAIADAGQNFGVKGTSNTGSTGSAANSATPSFSQTASLKGGADAAGASALNPFSQVGQSASATPGFAATTSSNLASNSANALAAIGTVPNTTSAMSGFNNQPTLSQTYNSSADTIGNANALQSSGGLGSKILNQAKDSATGIAKQALADTLAPDTQPIGVFDSFAPSDGGYSSDGLQYGDVLSAFGGQELNIANPNGPRINDEAFNRMVDRIGANAYLQQTQARDVAIPAGQYQAEQNTPYANRITQINKGSDQTYRDLIDQVNNANRYYGVIDSNPGLTNEQFNTFLQDPSVGVLGDFRVPTDQLEYFKTIRPVGPINNSLL